MEQWPRRCKIHFLKSVFSTDMSAVKKKTITPDNNCYTQQLGFYCYYICYKSHCSSGGSAASLPGPWAMLPDLPLMQIQAQVAGIRSPQAKRRQI